MPAASGDEEAPALPPGLTYGSVELVDARPEWTESCARLMAELQGALGADAVAVEHVGSTAVAGLPTKPILDVAVALARDANRERVVGALVQLRLEFRGDAGDEGGLVFVLESRPRHRIAHVHVVRHDDPQWQRYLAFRDILRADPEKREAYAALKRELAERHRHDRRSYTAGKAAFVEATLAEHFLDRSA